MNEYALVFIIAFTIAVLAFIVARLFKKQKPKFDERQELVRGKAYKHAFLAMLIYGALYISCSLLIEKEFLITSVALIIGMFIGLVVYAVYSIWNEAFFSLNDTPKTYIILLICTAFLNAQSGINTIVDGSIIENGTLALDSVSLICAVSFTIILMTMLIKIVINKKAEQEG